MVGEYSRLLVLNAWHWVSVFLGAGVAVTCPPHIHDQSAHYQAMTVFLLLCAGTVWIHISLRPLALEGQEITLLGFPKTLTHCGQVSFRCCYQANISVGEQASQTEEIPLGCVPTVKRCSPDRVTSLLGNWGNSQAYSCNYRPGEQRTLAESSSSLYMPEWILDRNSYFSASLWTGQTFIQM